MNPWCLASILSTSTLQPSPHKAIASPAQQGE